MANSTFLKKGRIIAVIVVAVVLVVCLTLYLCSYSIALSTIGFRSSNANILFTGIDSNSHEYRAVENVVGGERTGLALLTKNAIGLWTVSQATDTADSAGMMQIAWINAAGFRFFPNQTPKTVWEDHIVYCGNNAKRPIPDIAEKLPDNVTVDIQQNGSSYMLHFIYFGEDADTLSRARLSEILSEAGFI